MPPVVEVSGAFGLLAGHQTQVTVGSRHAPKTCAHHPAKQTTATAVRAALQKDHLVIAHHHWSQSGSQTLHCTVFDMADMMLLHHACGYDNVVEVMRSNNVFSPYAKVCKRQAMVICDHPSYFPLAVPQHLAVCVQQQLWQWSCTFWLPRDYFCTMMCSGQGACKTDAEP